MAKPTVTIKWEQIEGGVQNAVGRIYAEVVDELAREYLKLLEASFGPDAAACEHAKLTLLEGFTWAPDVPSFAEWVKREVLGG